LFFLLSVEKLIESLFTKLRKGVNQSCIATSVSSVRILHVVAFLKELLWFEATNVIFSSFENATTCSKRTLKTRVAMQLNERLLCT